MSTFSPYEVKRKLDEIGKDALLKEIPTYNELAQDFYYKTLKEIEAEDLEKYKTSLQEEAHLLAAGANKKSKIAIWVSIIAIIVSLVAPLYSTYIQQTYNKQVKLTPAANSAASVGTAATRQPLT